MGGAPCTLQSPMLHPCTRDMNVINTSCHRIYTKYRRLTLQRGACSSRSATRGCTSIMSPFLSYAIR